MTMTDPTTTTDQKLTTDPGFRLDYIVTDEAWYSRVSGIDRDEPSITVSKSADGGFGCAWEFTIADKRKALGGRAGVQVQVFDDAFAAFVELAPLFATLAAERPNTLDQVRVLLDELGLVDATERQRPVRRPAGEGA
jgi:hypothetical protein